MSKLTIRELYTMMGNLTPSTTVYIRTIRGAFIKTVFHGAFQEYLDFMHTHQINDEVMWFEVLTGGVVSIYIETI